MHCAVQPLPYILSEAHRHTSFKLSNSVKGVLPSVEAIRQESGHHVISLVGEKIALLLFYAQY